MSNQTSRMRMAQILLAFSLLGAPDFRVLSQRDRTPSPAILKWEALIPEITEVLQRSAQACPEEHDNVQIVDAFEADGLSFALVDYCQSGASTDSIVAMQLEAGRPIVSRFLKSNGARLDVEFVSGTSVTHSDGTRLVPEKKAIFHTSSMSDAEGRPRHCSVEAYVWNPQLRAFQMNARVSREATHDSCSNKRIH